MFDILFETFLYEYFLYKCILGKYASDEALVACLKNIYQLENVDVLYQATTHEIIREIETEEDYKQYRRINQYYYLENSKKIGTEEEELMISIKGEALKVATKTNLFAKPEMTASLIQRNLMHYAKTGSLVAMRLLGVLFCEGILVPKAFDKGIEYLKKAASWADITASLALFHYDSGKQDALNTIAAITKDTPFEEIPTLLKEKYGLSAPTPKEEIFLLKKAMANEKLELDTYDPMYARLVYSTAIRLKDKEKILFSENKEAISEACDLPIKLVYKDIILPEFKSIFIPLRREGELAGLEKSLKNCDLRQLSTYQPLCLVADSEYILEMYAHTIQEIFKDEHIERIDVADLREIDFEPTKNHAFTRTIEDSQNNIELFVFKGDVKELAIEQVKSFLKTDKRSKFHINHPAITLDLSSILPICICDRENAKKLKGYVEILKLSPVVESEKASIIEDMFSSKSKSYHMLHALIDASAVDQLCSYPLETAEKILDRIIKDSRVQSLDLHLTVEQIMPYLQEKKSNGNKNGYGFGGTIL